MAAAFIPAGHQVRNALRAHLSAGARPTLVDEFWVPRSNERADLVAVGDRMEAFEIKSTRDRLHRLPRQVAAYGRLFDSCSAVIAERHACAVSDTVPLWWGIAVIRPGDECIAFEWLRDPEFNAHVDSETVVRLLWREEVRSALTALGRPPDPQRTRAQMWGDLLAVVDAQSLRTLVTRAVAARDPSTARMPSRRFDFSSAGL